MPVGCDIKKCSAANSASWQELSTRSRFLYRRINQRRERLPTRRYFPRPPVIAAKTVQNLPNFPYTQQILRNKLLRLTSNATKFQCSAPSASQIDIDKKVSHQSNVIREIDAKKSTPDGGKSTQKTSRSPSYKMPRARASHISFLGESRRFGGASEETDKDENIVVLEKRYLLSCERGDIGSVRHYLQFATTHQEFDINCIDPLGRTALLIAIENENIEMIESLLDSNVETGDALLYAINEENVEAVEIILNHVEKMDKFTAENQGVEITEHSAFTPDITPIILAAHRDNYEIIKLLLDRGASIPHPHDVRCACRECIQANADDSLRLSKSRINAYRALASPSLICLSARDPILYAFELSWELRRLSGIENEFKIEYIELSQRCQNFSTEMLDQVRGSKELEIVLNHDTSDKIPRERAPGERMQLARLKLAIQFRQKRFVAHANCQQLLGTIWYEGLPGFRRRHMVFKVLLMMATSLAFPLLALWYLLLPKSSFSRFIRRPFIKFLCHSTSYFFFLFILILASQRINYDEIFSSPAPKQQMALNKTLSATSTVVDESPDRKERRGPPPTPVEWAVIFYVAGLIWVEVKQLWDSGLHEYVHNMWNILDFITNSLYICTFVLRTIAYIQVQREMSDPRTAHIGRKLARRFWDAWDPTLISECFFATANIFSSLKLVHIFTVNPHLGPLQISLGRMVVDILKFGFVYMLVLFAFACGLNQLFWYYATMRAQECTWSMARHEQMLPVVRAELSDSCSKRFKGFANLFNSLESLFWATFGLVDLSHFELKESHYMTEWAGKTMFGTYGYISTIVLLNMLIAMMSNSYQYISNQADTEWKFARSKLWIEYFDEGGTLPPPFNIVPSPKSAYYVIRWFCDRYCQHCTRRLAQTKHRSVKLQKILKAVSQKEQNYQLVMRNLVRRYIAHEQRKKQQGESISVDDVNEIKQDISGFRFELLGILRDAGFSTGHADYTQKVRTNKRGRTAERRMMKGIPVHERTAAGANANANAMASTPTSNTPTSAPSPGLAPVAVAPQCQNCGCHQTAQSSSRTDIRPPAFAANNWPGANVSQSSPPPSPWSNTRVGPIPAHVAGKRVNFKSDEISPTLLCPGSTVITPNPISEANQNWRNNGQTRPSDTSVHVPDVASGHFSAENSPCLPCATASKTHSAQSKPTLKHSQTSISAGMRLKGNSSGAGVVPNLSSTKINSSRRLQQSSLPNPLQMTTTNLSISRKLSDDTFSETSSSKCDTFDPRRGDTLL